MLLNRWSLGAIMTVDSKMTCLNARREISTIRHFGIGSWYGELAVAVVSASGVSCEGGSRLVHFQVLFGLGALIQYAGKHVVLNISLSQLVKNFYVLN